MSVQGLETERDFYFSKLRDIEVMCQEHEGEPLVSDILSVMYATEVCATPTFKYGRDVCIAGLGSVGLVNIATKTRSSSSNSKNFNFPHFP